MYIENTMPTQTFTDPTELARNVFVTLEHLTNNPDTLAPWRDAILTRIQDIGEALDRKNASDEYLDALINALELEKANHRYGFLLENLFT